MARVRSSQGPPGTVRGPTQRGQGQVKDELGNGLVGVVLCTCTWAGADVGLAMPTSTQVQAPV